LADIAPPGGDRQERHAFNMSPSEPRDYGVGSDAAKAKLREFASSPSGELATALRVLQRDADVVIEDRR
jgi:hypothetical protein